jgi:signal recognition particle receptor subunit alpha
MLDHFSIFTKGGVVLWSYDFAAIQGRPVDALVREILIEERAGEHAFETGVYTVKWTLANELSLVFVVSIACILIVLLSTVKLTDVYVLGSLSENIANCVRR